ELAAARGREEEPQKTVKQITEENHRRHPEIELHRQGQDRDQEKETRNRTRRSPVNRLEAGITKLAEHHEGKKKHERRQRVFPAADRPLSFIEPEKEECDRSNHTCRARRRTRRARIYNTVGRTGRGTTVEPRQPQRTAGQ